MTKPVNLAPMMVPRDHERCDPVPPRPLSWWHAPCVG